MTTNIEFTKNDLLDRGALLGIPKPNLLFHPAVVETRNGELYWVNKFASDQSDTHSIPYDRISVSGDVGLTFWLKNKVVAYLALYDQWHEANIDDYRDENARWTEWLKDSDHRNHFDEFVSANRP